MNNSKYTHQCRYCAYCVFTIENTYWCDELNIYITAPKRSNKCDSFLFNAIPADNPGGKPYTPRKKRDGTQLRLFDMPTDRQRNKTEGKRQMTHEQVDAIENKLRDAQNLVEECGDAICGERGENASNLWNALTLLSDEIGDAIHAMWRLRTEEWENEK